jgi:two-component sensor histidine kinase
VRILDEAVTNAVKHADAKRIAVSIETLKEMIPARPMARSPSRMMVRDLRLTVMPQREGAKRDAASPTCEAAPQGAARRSTWSQAAARA